MRLIDADAKIVAQIYDDEHEDWILKEMTVADYLSFSDTSIPFIDAVPVVRCKDCRYRVDPTSAVIRMGCCGQKTVTFAVTAKEERSKMHNPTKLGIVLFLGILAIFLGAVFDAIGV